MKTLTKQEPNEHVAHKKSKNAKAKLKIKSIDNNTETQEGEHQVESFQTLLSNLATICRNDCRTAKDHTIVLNTTTMPTTFQETLLNQLKNIADNLNTPQ
jgi:hypothetical protein